MASWFSGHAAPLVAVASLFALMCVVFMRDTATHIVKMRNFAASKKLLTAHLELIQSLVDDHRVPEKLKENLVIFSGLIVDDAAFLELWKKSCEAAATSPPPKELSSYQKDLAGLYAIDPDLGNKLETAVRTAIHGMLLKLPKAQEHFAESCARVADARSGSYIFASAVERKRRTDTKIGADEFSPGTPAVA